MKNRLVFDLDETLGVALVNSNSVVGFNIRQGCLDLLEKLSSKYELVLWSVSNRSYVNKMLSGELGKFFKETYSWNEVPQLWKDIRIIKGDYLIDDDSYQKEMAEQVGLGNKYIIVPVYGNKIDEAEPLYWVKIIEKSLL
jgi:glutaredoxin-related protein